MTGEEFSIERIDDVIHGRLRLGIMAYLSTAGSADFVTLKAKTHSSDGNLSVQVRKLEEADYVTVTKAFAGKKPVTTITLTETGRAAFVAYLDAMRKLIDGAG